MADDIGNEIESPLAGNRRVVNHVYQRDNSVNLGGRMFATRLSHGIRARVLERGDACGVRRHGGRVRRLDNDRGRGRLRVLCTGTPAITVSKRT